MPSHAVLLECLCYETWQDIRYEYDCYGSRIHTQRVAETFSALFLPNLSGEISSPLQAQPSLTKMRFRSTAERCRRCMKMWKQAGLLIQTCLVYMYDCMYVSWNMLVYLIFFILWILLVKPQSGVKATLKNIWSQNAKEPGDACRIPRGAWKLHRCIEHATRWILYRMEPTFYVVVGANFRPQPLALRVSNVWQALSSEESIQICLTRFVTWLIMTDTAFFEMCQKSIDRRRMSCFLHLNLIPSIQRNYAKPIGLVSTKVCWKHKQHDNSRHSAWHSYSVSSCFIIYQVVTVKM